jgi:hypothetical protein
MPLLIHIPKKELFDEKNGKFITVKETNISLEHSLISISNWESKWHKPYLSSEKKTTEEFFSYLQCMCLTKNVDPNVFYALDGDDVKKIAEYITDSMTATTFKNHDQKKSREIITSELIYFWMTNFNIPFEPCQKWHLNRLLTLIEIASIKNQPPKKMGKREAAQQRAALNASRRAKYNTRG